MGIWYLLLHLPQNNGILFLINVRRKRIKKLQKMEFCKLLDNVLMAGVKLIIRMGIAVQNEWLRCMFSKDGLQLYIELN